MSSTTGQPRNRRYIRVSQQRKTKLRCSENSIEHQNVHRRRSSSSSASVYIRVYTSKADFHKPEIYGGRVRVWATERDVFHRTPSRGGRGRRAAKDIFRCVFFQCLVGFRFFSFSLLRTHTLCVFLVSGGISFFFRFLYFERTRPTASTRQPCLMYLSSSNETRPRERSDQGRFLPLGKKPSSYRSAYRVPLFN